jgi:hypothetical protein
MDLPEQINDSEQDDFQTSNLDLNSLVGKFISPIEKIRSISAPTIFNSPQSLEDGVLIQRALNAAQVDPANAQESRCHAFFRMLGLPVVARELSFYNSGFNPKRSSTSVAHNRAVDSKISNDMNLMAQFRESSARNRLVTFQKSGLDNAVYSLVLFFLKPFNLIGTGKWDNQDPQTFTIADRKSIASSYKKSNGDEITNFFDSGSHILRPFVVNPSIGNTVMPADRLICEPFLKSKNDTKLDSNKLLYRPGIETILRSRLKEPADEDLFKSIIFTLDSQEDVSGFSSAELKTLAEFLLQENKLTSSINVSNLELINISRLIKQIKLLINLLIKSVEDIFDVILNIDWKPLGNESGPEFGTELGNFVSLKRKVSELEQKIKELKVLQKKAELSRKEEVDLGEFALEPFEDTENLFDQELAQADSQKAEFIKLGSISLQSIEYIVGEISGLGLVDIISIYMALWSVEIDVLLSMLDDAAFARLYDNNPDLRTAEVEGRHSSGAVYNIYEAIEIFDAQVSSILAYTDKLLASRLSGVFNYTGSIGV